MRHHTKDKGDRGVGFVIADLLSKGIQICLPISEHLPFDLVAVYPDGSLKKVSVKYRAATEGFITVPFRSSYSDRNGCHTKNIDKSLIDIMAVYCPDTGKVYYVDPKQFGETAVTLRLEPTKNNVVRGVKMAEDYLVP